MVDANAEATLNPGQNPSPLESTAEEAENTSSGRLQLEVMDISDAYVSAMWAAMDEYIKSEPDAAKRVIAQNWKVTFASSAMEIAAANDPRLNLLDMAVFMSAGKWAVDTYWVPDVFGEKASRLREVYTQMNKETWELADRILNEKQRQDLRNLIAAWKSENPAAYEVANVRLRNLEGVKLQDFDETATAKGLFASVRKLLGRVDSSLLYGERVMFYMERTPRILTQQTDLTLAQIAEAFPIAAVKPDFAGVSEMFKDLPKMIQASIDQNQGFVREIVPEIRATVESGDHLAVTLDGTVKTLRELSENLKGVEFTNSPVETLREANALLVHLDSTVAGVNLLLARDAAGESRVTELARVLDDRTDRLMQVAFQRALILLAVFFGGVVLVLVIAKLLFSRRKSAE